MYIDLVDDFTLLSGVADLPVAILPSSQYDLFYLSIESHHILSIIRFFFFGFVFKCHTNKAEMSLWFKCDK